MVRLQTGARAASEAVASRILVVLAVLGVATIPYCTGMVVLPISGEVRDARTLLPIDGADVLIEVRTPLFSLHGERSQPFFALRATTDEGGRYHVPLTVQGFVDWRTTLRRVYRVTAAKEGYAAGGGWSMEYFTGVTYRDTPFETWLERDPKPERESRFEGRREAIREALDFPVMVFPIGQLPDDIDSLSAENRRKEYVDEILRYLNFVGFMMKSDGEAPQAAIENLQRHCRNVSTIYDRYSRHEPRIRQDIEDFLSGSYEGRDVSSLADTLARPARVCLLGADGELPSATDQSAFLGRDRPPWRASIEVRSRQAAASMDFLAGQGRRRGLIAGFGRVRVVTGSAAIPLYVRRFS